MPSPRERNTLTLQKFRERLGRPIRNGRDRLLAEMILEIFRREACEVEVDRACAFGKPTGKARSVGDELHLSGPGLGNVPVFNLSVADMTARVSE